MLVDRGHPHGLIFDKLREEHRTLLRLLDESLEAPEGDPEARRAAFARFTRLLRAHSRAEEEIVFPVLDGSEALGHHVREDARDHAMLEARVRRIDRTPATGPVWAYDVASLRELLVRHFADEELVLFPRAVYVISDVRAAELLELYAIDRDLDLERPPTH